MEQFIGQIQPFAFGVVPKGWAQCNGQLLPVNSNQALFALLSNTFGGDGKTTFGLPNLQGVVAIGSGPDGLGNTYTFGSTGGEASHILQLGEMPNHTHALNAIAAAGTAPSPTNNYLSQAGDQNGAALNMYGTGPATGTLSPNTVSSNGSGQGHENRMPFTVVNYCIALQGYFPVRG